MEEENTMEVGFNIHGATCHSCNMTLRSTQEEWLKQFHDLHADHPDFAWIATVAAPAEFVDGREFEMRFSSC